jgi:integrase
VPALPEVVALWGLQRSSGLVFPARGGEMHRGSPLRRPLEQACAKAGVARVTAHGLRRTFNNDGRKVGAREVLKSITGHDTDAMTEHYSLIAADEKTELARTVGARMGVFDVSDTGTPEGAK